LATGRGGIYSDLNFHFHFCFLVGFPCRICDVLELLSWFAIRRDAGLHVPAPTVPYTIPNAQPPVRLRFRLEHVETEGCCYCNAIQQLDSPEYHAEEWGENEEERN